MGKKLQQLLQEKKGEILEKWEDSILSCFRSGCISYL